MKMNTFHDSKDVAAPAVFRAIPRPLGLTLVIALIIMPWVGKAAIWHTPVKHTGVAVDKDPALREIGAGKWGELTLVPIVLSPPMELVSTDWGEIRYPAWFFPGANADKAVQMLQSAGVSAADADHLRTEARVEPRIEGVVITPDPAFVRSLTPEVRARVYAMLAKSELNQAQARPFMYPGSKAEAWLDPSLISPITRQIVEPFIYRQNGYMLFSDIQLVRERIGSDDELRRLSKALFRQPTVLA